MNNLQLKNTSNSVQSKTEDIPPLIIRKKEIWTTLSTQMKNKMINFTKAEPITDGIKVKPSSSDDFRKLIQLLDEHSYPYHTFQLPEEKLLHIVFRGVPECIAIEEVREDLINKGFHPEKVYRMRNSKTKASIPLVLVLLSSPDKEIFETTKVLHLKISVETFRPKTSIGQCHNCQKFGHSQARCKAPPKCAKCGENHKTSECLLTSILQATRAAPNIPKLGTQRNHNPTNYTFYSEAVKQIPNTQPAEELYEKMLTLFKQFENKMSTCLSREHKYKN